MKLELIRKYYTKGTNGMLYINDAFECFTIELPWKDNQPRISCIPEGAYALKKRYSLKFKEHLLVDGVKGRDVILIHPANDALKELKGCIAPVSILTGEGKGLQSRAALEKIKSPVLESIKNKEPISLIIKSIQNDNKRKNSIAHSPLL